MAQGGVAAALGEDDSAESHTLDTIAAGAGLCDEPAVRLVIERGRDAVSELIDWGMEADRDEHGRLRFGQEGAHSAPRIVHAHGDATGKEIQRCLLARSDHVEAIRVFDSCFALDLLTPNDEPGAPVMGAITHHPRYGLQVVWARATILAAGGAGMLYRETTNPSVATADGIAMAYRAGATVSDMAFVQFHPTTLYIAGASRSLISEAVRGEGAYLLDENEYRFMPDVHEQAELAPRDVVARAIVHQIARQGGSHVWLDTRHVKGFAERFPSITDRLKLYQLDPERDLIPVHPAAHYMIGGVRTDLTGRTNVPGLYAVGEVACVGLHGANRLASNSLLEGLVMGGVAGAAAEEMRRGNGPNGWNAPARPAPVRLVSDIRPSEHGELDLTDVRSSLRSVMWRHVGIERNTTGLCDVGDMIDFWARYCLDKIFDEPAGWETQNLLLAGALVVRSACWRKESRGSHARADHPERSEEYLVHDGQRRGEAELTTEPVARAANAAEKQT
jgi:L-aspartate oxidase